jgi:hypothetical protein
MEMEGEEKVGDKRIVFAGGLALSHMTLLRLLELQMKRQGVFQE